MIEVKINAGTANARCVLRGRSLGRCDVERVRGQLQLIDQALGRILAEGAHRSLPTGLDSFHQPLGGIRQQRRAGHRVNRQTVGNLRQGLQVQLVGLEFAACGNPALGSGVINRDITTWPVQAVTGVKCQRLGGKLKTVGRQAPAQAPADRQQFQRLQLRAQGDIDLRQGHVGRAACHLATADIDPGAQCALALAQIDADIGVAPQLGQVHPRKGGVELALPVSPMAAMA